MSKITLNDITTEFRGQASINANFTSIEEEFQNKVLYRDNPTGEPNSMQNHLDMNGYYVLNAGNPSIADANNIAYTFDDSAAEVRTISDKLNEVVSVKDFGAVGDGVADDTSAIQAALNAALAIGGGAVHLAHGEIYRITQKINIPSGCGLFGDGSPTIYAPSVNFNNTSLTNKYASNSAVIDLSGQTSSPYTSSESPFLIGIKIESEVSQGRFVDAIVCRNAINPRISKCEIFGFAAGCGIRAASLPYGAEFSNNYIHDFLENTTAWVGTPQSTGIEIDNDRVNSVYSSGVKINGNEIRKIEFGSAAITAYGYQTDAINIAGVSTTDYVIHGNSINTVGEGVDTFGERGSIVGNVITDTYGFGIKLIHGASLNTVHSNVIRNTGIAGIVAAGSTISGVGNITKNNIIGNIIENIDYLGVWAPTTGTAGIKIDNSTSSYTYRVTNNIFSSNLIDGSGKSGIITGTDPDKNMFIGNRIVSQPSVAWVSGSETTPIYDAIQTGLNVGLNADQSISASVFAKIQFNSVLFDIRSEYDSSANYRWTCQIPGIYSVHAQIRFNTVAANKNMVLYVRKNNNDVLITNFTATGYDQTESIGGYIQCASGDYIEIFLWHNDTVSRAITGATSVTFLHIAQI